MNCGIYKITQLSTGKSYIGQSINIEKRLQQHYDSPHSDWEWDYHINPTNYTIQILELCDKEILDEKEKFWIKKENSFIQGLNETTGGKTQNLMSDFAPRVLLIGGEEEFNFYFNNYNSSVYQSLRRLLYSNKLHKFLISHLKCPLKKIMGLVIQTLGSHIIIAFFNPEAFFQKQEDEFIQVIPIFFHLRTATLSYKNCFSNYRAQFCENFDNLIYWPHDFYYHMIDFPTPTIIDIREKNNFKIPHTLIDVSNYDKLVYLKKGEPFLYIMYIFPFWENITRTESFNKYSSYIKGE